MDNQSRERPVPAFYCCYLLRSTIRHASLYIGSTPNPSRRLAQHNGTVKGGAHRTAREKLRPWEMVILVEGFTSRIAALQFEWAWQHPGDSRHVKHDGTDVSIKTRNPGAPPCVPRRSLTAHLSNLHLLLQSTYFSSWPLKVRFFSADVYRVWNLWCQRADGRLPKDILIIENSSSELHDSASDSDRVGSIQQVKVDYSRIQDYIEKATFLLDGSEDLRCGECQVTVHPKDELVVVCPQKDCHYIAHLLCLSQVFSNATEESQQLVPKYGICPSCKGGVQWSLMMQELTLRHRGGRVLRGILKKGEKKGNPRSVDIFTGRHIDASRSLVEQDTPVLDSLSERPARGRSTKPDRLPSSNARCESPLDENWLDNLEFSDFGVDINAQPKQDLTRIEIVIDDSDGLE